MPDANFPSMDKLLAVIWLLLALAIAIASGEPDECQRQQAVNGPLAEFEER